MWIETKMKQEITPEPIKNPALRFGVITLATGLGLGFAPFAPGTAGSLLGLVVGIWSLQLSLTYAIAICVVLMIVGVWVSENACRHWGQMDSGRIVIDEVLGQAIPFLVIRQFAQLDSFTLGATQIAVPTLGYLVAAFAAFRVFDIFKPFPAKTFDRQGSGFGVMADDVVAGIYAAIFVWALYRIRF